MKNLWFICLLVQALFSAAQQPKATFYLIGDAGAKTQAGPALAMLKDSAKANKPNAVIFLGDNIYPDGLHTSGKLKAESEAKLNVQLDAALGYAKNTVFMPGNHDWAASKARGYEAIIAQANFLTSRGAQFYPKDGRPGPTTVKLADSLYAVFIDTQWFLHQQPFHSVGVKGKRNRKTVAETSFVVLDSILKMNSDRGFRTVLFFHHPMYTNGSHGSARQPMRFLVNYTPLHILGMVGATRLLRTDIGQPIFKRMRKQLLGIVDKYKNVVCVSGHDHYQQLFNVNGNYHLVTGAGSKLSHKHTSRFTELFYNDQQQGYVRLDLLKGNKLKATFYGATDRKVLYSLTF